jgi:hypothetical protein
MKAALRDAVAPGIPRAMITNSPDDYNEFDGRGSEFDVSGGLL